jgi:hypothetical protein
MKTSVVLRPDCFFETVDPNDPNVRANHTIELTTMPGVMIDAAINEAIEIARVTNKWVSFTHNGKRLGVSKDSNISEVYDSWCKRN